MRVFVTGATGFVGRAVVTELLAAGHRVLGLARSDANAGALRAQGAEVHRGDLTDPAGLAEGARACDGVVHTAFNHDFSRFAENCEMDARAIQALGEALAGSARPLLVTSGVARLAPGRLATEQDAPPVASPAYPRRSEAQAEALAARGIRACVVRLAPSVHGAGDHGFVPHLVQLARQKGVAAYVGDGRNRWPAVHVLDTARLYRLALEQGSAGARYNAVAEEGVPLRDIAEAIGRRLNVPVVAKSPDEATSHFGFLGFFVSGDAPASSAQTQERLGWRPVQPGLIADLDPGPR